MKKLKEKIGSSFSRNAQNYALYAPMQVAMADLLAQKIATYPINKKGVWLDIGSGPAILHKYLFEPQNIEKTILFDLASKSLLLGKERYHDTWGVCGDMDSFPFQKESFDGIVSSSAFQWSSSPQEIYAATIALLKKGGFSAFGLLVEGTLSPLQTFFKENSLPQATTFLSVAEINRLLKELPLKIHFEEEIILEEAFDNAKEALQAISAIGASPTLDTKIAPTLLKKLMQTYQKDAGKNERVINSYHFYLIIAEKI